MSPELVAEAILGKDAEEFLNSEIGRYLIGAAEQEAKEAMDLLARVHPWRKNRITELQNRIWRAQSFQSWMAELIVTGRQAMDNLTEE